MVSRQVVLERHQGQGQGCSPQVGQGMPLPLLSSKVLGVLEHEENKEVGELSIEPTQDDRNHDRQIRKQNSLKNFEINMKGKWYRNARPLVGNLTPNHQL